MKLTKQFTIILLFVLVGELLHLIIPFIPSYIIGMILLLIALATKLLPLEQIKEVANFLLSHLGIFFIPAGVGILLVMDVIQPVLVIMLFICILTTIVTMSLTALIIQAIRRKQVQKS